MNATITVRFAEASDLDQLAELFDQYRQFYQCSPDLGAARAWLAENIKAGRSTIFAADSGSELLGFTQLYPALCSVDLVDYFVLYDLFVVEAARRQGIARALMNAASDWARGQGAARLGASRAGSQQGARAAHRGRGHGTGPAPAHV